jgi:hypothetical protein
MMACPLLRRSAGRDMKTKVAGAPHWRGRRSLTGPGAHDAIALPTPPGRDRPPLPAGRRSSSSHLVRRLAVAVRVRRVRRVRQHSCRATRYVSLRYTRNSRSTSHRRCARSTGMACASPRTHDTHDDAQRMTAASGDCEPQRTCKRCNPRHEPTEATLSGESIAML